MRSASMSSVRASANAQRHVAAVMEAEQRREQRDLFAVLVAAPRRAPWRSARSRRSACPPARSRRQSQSSPDRPRRVALACCRSRICSSITMRPLRACTAVANSNFAFGNRFEVLEALVVGRANRRQNAMVRRRERAQALDRADAVGAHLDDEILAAVVEPLIDDAGDAHHRVDAARREQCAGVELQDVPEDVLDGGLAERAGNADDRRVDLAQAGLGALRKPSWMRFS